MGSYRNPRWKAELDDKSGSKQRKRWEVNIIKNHSSAIDPKSMGAKNPNTDDVNVADLADHRLAVDLAHVLPGIFRLDAADVQMPRPLMVVANAETAHPSHHLPVDCEDHLTVEMNPGDLNEKRNATWIFKWILTRMFFKRILPGDCPGCPQRN